MKIVITIIPPVREPLKAGFSGIFSFLANQGNQVHLLVNQANLDLRENSTWFNPVVSRKNWLFGIIPFLNAGLTNIKWILRLSRWKKDLSVRQVLLYHFSVLVFFDRFLKTQNPDLILIWNPFCYSFGVLSDIAARKGIRTVTIEWGPLENTIYLDPYGSQTLTKFAKSSLGDLQHQVYKLPAGVNTIANQYKQSSEGKIWDEIRNSKPNRKILVLGTSEVDSGVIPNWHKDRKLVYPYFKNGFHCAEQTARFAGRDDIVIYKPHPSHNPFPESKMIRPGFYIVNADPGVLIEWSDFVIASATKLELMVIEMGKPLILPGAGLLFGKKLANEPGSLKEYSLLIKNPEKVNPENIQENYQVILQFLNATLIDLCVPDSGILKKSYNEFIKE